MSPSSYFSGSSRLPLLLPLLLAAVSAEPLYSTNAICQQRRCVNPVFPALKAMEKHEEIQWQCLEPQYAVPHMDFCKGIVNYMIGVRSPPPGTNRTVRSVVMEQDQAAATAYFYHLSAMGIEAWEHVSPDYSYDDGDCVRSVQDMVCATFFPRARSGCQMGQETNYLRPCRGACDRYIQACGIQCCDESVQCVFDHSVSLLDGTRQVFSGYVNEISGSSTCTGNLVFSHSGASRGAASGGGVLALLLTLGSLLHALGGIGMPSVPSWRRLTAVGALAVMSLSLQGCEFHYHRTANWREKPHYMLTFEYVPPVASELTVADRQPILNSCEVEWLDEKDQCSGHGECRQWNLDSTMKKPMMFCACHRDWADPECRTRRKSQATAFWLSLFGGILGMDRFYLKQPALGAMKLASLGGFGFWWAYDIVLIGSDPIYAGDYRVAYDLSHWLYVFASLGFFSFLGLIIFVVMATRIRRMETRATMLQSLEQAYDDQRHKDFITRLTKDTMPSLSSFGVPAPHPHVFYGAAEAPEVVKSASLDNTHSSYNVFAGLWNHMQQHGQTNFGPRGERMPTLPAADAAGGRYGTVLRSVPGGPAAPSRFVNW